MGIHIELLHQPSPGPPWLQVIHESFFSRQIPQSCHMLRLRGSGSSRKSGEMQIGEMWLQTARLGRACASARWQSAVLHTPHPGKSTWRPCQTDARTLGDPQTPPPSLLPLANVSAPDTSQSKPSWDHAGQALGKTLRQAADFKEDIIHPILQASLVAQW